MKILVTGSSGLVGTTLVPFLRNVGHEVVRVVRQPSNDKNTIVWNPEKGTYRLEDFEGFDAAINLAGDNIFSSLRWSDEKKKKIMSSRVDAARTLCACFKRLKSLPKVLISASAVGYYGNQGAVVVNEDSPSGTGFLAEVCREWEAAADSAQQLGMRVVRLRIGVVLTPQGGALGKMLLPFKLGLGGIVGSGQQYVSWITLDDLLNVILFALTSNSLQGAVNAVTENAVTNEEWTKTMGKVLHRPTFLPVPAFALRLIMGEVADEVLLSSTRAVPERLQQAGFRFAYPQLEDALRHLLG
jgi:hypothetical protein